jgi:hypothetical protein
MPVHYAGGVLHPNSSNPCVNGIQRENYAPDHNRKIPSLPAWQGSDWSEMLMDGLRLYGAQIVLMLPLFIVMGCGMISMFGGSLGISALADESTSAIAPIGMLLMMIGFLFFGLFSVLSIPYSVILYGMLPHVAVKGTFQAAFEFNEWFPIFRKALGQFILGFHIEPLLF